VYGSKLSKCVEAGYLLLFHEKNDHAAVRVWLSGMQIDKDIANRQWHRPIESSTYPAHSPASEFFNFDAAFSPFLCSTCDTGCCKEDKDDAIHKGHTKAGALPPMQRPPVNPANRSSIDSTGRLPDHLTKIRYIEVYTWIYRDVRF
jgi:hypothetical protein